MDIIKIADIRINDRYRKDLGDIQALAESIERQGLLQPIGLTPEHDLVFGVRRIEAFKFLGMDEIPYRVVNVTSIVEGEHDENELRKDLTFDERVEIGRTIERLLGERRGNPSFRCEDSPIVENFPHLEPGTKTRDIAAKVSGFGNARTYEQAKKVVDHGSDVLVGAVQSGEASIFSASTLSDLPHEEQDEIVARGEVEILRKSKEIRQRSQEQRKFAKLKQEQCALDKLDPDTDLWTFTADQTVIPCDALIVDPPYGILSEDWEPDDLQAFTLEWATRWDSCQADFVLIFWSQRYLFTGREWFDQSLSNYKFQQLLVRHYRNNKSPQSRMGFKQTWEPIFFYRRLDSDKEIQISGTQWGNELNDFDCHVAAVPQTNFNGSEFKQHPAQKPVSGLRWLVNVASRPGDLICDPFCGSGTTGIAATQLNRRFHGIEINEDYLEMAKRRITCYGKLQPCTNGSLSAENVICHN